MNVPMRKLRWTLCSFSLMISVSHFVQAAAPQAANAYSAKETASGKQSIADISISIDPAKIIEILRREPGLTFTVKKMLADAALQEGRLLDDTSFPDSTLYYLIQTDDNIRAMVTSELIRSKYILVQPTEQETADEYLRQRQAQTVLSRRARDREEEQQLVYSASDPEKRVNRCEPAEQDSSGNCVTAIQNNRGAQGKPASNPTTDPGPQPTPIQATDLPQLFARSGMASGTSSGLSPATAAAMTGSTPQPALSSERELLNTPSSANRKPAISAGQRADNDATPQDDLVLKRKASPYDSVPSLIDLYSQVDRRYENITRFGTSL